MSKNIYEIGLEPHPANHAPLSPIKFLRRTAAVYPERIGLIDGSARYTWAQIDRRCRQLASALARHGIGVGDTVSMFAPNGAPIFEAHFGVPMCGAVLNNINIRLDPATVAFILNHCEATVLIVDSEFSETIKAALPDVVNTKLLIVDIVDPRGNGGEPIGEIDYESFISSGDPAYISDQPLHEGQALSLNYTSGTTGNPKGVVYDHRNAFVESVGNLLSWGMAEHPVQLWVVPIFHANGWCYLWAMTALAATNVMLRKPSGRSILQAIAEHDVTHLCGAPIVAQLMAEVPEAERPRLRHPVKMLTAGSPPTAAHFMAMENMGIELTQGYGLTEVWGPAVICVERPEWKTLPASERARLKARQGVPNLVVEDIIVADRETLQAVARDGQTLGEVLFRGNVVMRGYLKNPQATATAFAGGWFHSGDLAVWYPDGYIELRDRSNDIIISGGENISSIELEAVIAGHPAVASAAVVARPDERWGETPFAFVELKPGQAATEQEIIEYCRSNLARFKVPRRVVFEFFPRTSTGKVQKYLLRKRAAEL